jgi:glutathione S-transferase
MSRLELLELYPSPFSERVRWALEAARLPYKRRDYEPLAGEQELVRTTGHNTVPILFCDGEVVGDSNAALDWVAAHHPGRALLPPEPTARAQVRAWELAATEGLAPAARLVMIGGYRAAGVQPLADHFSAKYHWSEAAQRQADALLSSVLPELTAAVQKSPHLVGDGFTRADLTVACMLAPVLGLPPDDLFALDEGMRGMFGLPLAGEPALAPLHAWRNETYRRHRGHRVLPKGDDSEGS